MSPIVTLGALLILVCACGSSQSSSSDQTPKQILYGRWGTGCKETTSQEKFLVNAKARTTQLSFNDSDGWVYEEFFSDSICKNPMLSVLYAGTYRIDSFKKPSISKNPGTIISGMDTTSIDYAFATVTISSAEPDTVQELNNTKTCGGGLSQSVPKLAMITDCLPGSVPRMAHPFNLLGVSKNSLAVGLYSAVKNGTASATRPDMLDADSIMSRL